MKKASSLSLPEIIVVVVVVAVGASIVAGQLGISFARPAASASRSAQQSPPVAGKAPAAGQARKKTFAVRAEKIAMGSVIDYTKIHGDVVASNETKVYPNVAGKLFERKLTVGSGVEKGSVIALVDPSRAGVSYLPNAVESPVAGTVLSIPVHEGDTITTGTVIATIGNLSSVRIATAVPERFLANLSMGSGAEISFDAVPGALFSARVSEMSPVVDPSSRTLDIKLELDRQDRRILAGMLATVKVVTDSRRGVVVAPRTAVSLTSTDASVFVIRADGTVERRIVTLGLEGEDSFEVRSGLKPGERVVTDGKGSISEGDGVRVIGDPGAVKAP